MMLNVISCFNCSITNFNFVWPKKIVLNVDFDFPIHFVLL